MVVQPPKKVACTPIDGGPAGALEGPGRLALAGLIAAAAAVFPLRDGHAQTWGGTVSLVSERISRGLSLSDGHPGATADLFYRDDRNWALGLGLGTMNPDQGPKAEAIVSATRWWQVDDHHTVTLSGAYYDYLGGEGTSRLRYSEVSLGGLWDGGRWGQWGGTVSLSPDLGASTAWGYLGHRGATIVELTWHRRIAGAVAADLGWGIVSNWGGGDTGSYRSANAGLSYTAGAWRFTVSRLYSSVPKKQRWVAGVGWSF